MTGTEASFQTEPHDHVFLGKDHDKAERRTWAVIVLCSVMMIAEIIGGALFGSLALIADRLLSCMPADLPVSAAPRFIYRLNPPRSPNFPVRNVKFGDLAGY